MGYNNVLKLEKYAASRLQVRKVSLAIYGWAIAAMTALLK
jgi:hypothetical protein